MKYKKCTKCREIKLLNKKWRIVIYVIVIILFTNIGILDIKNNKMNIEKDKKENPFIRQPLINIPEKLDLSSLENVENMFRNCNSIEFIYNPKIDLSLLEEKKNTLKCPSLKEIPNDLDLSNIKSCSFTDIVKQKKDK